MKFSIDAIARIAHEANARLRIELGEEPTPPWEQAPDDMRLSVLNGVQHVIAEDGLTPEQSHENWLAWKKNNGWTYGQERDFVAKKHPNMVPYDQLPAEQRAKDVLFTGIVRALAGLS